MSESDDWWETFSSKFEDISGRTPNFEPEEEKEDVERPQEEGKDAERLRESLYESLSIGGGEEFSAEEHRGREILELLQNARDAARGEGAPEDRIGSRAVYVQITDSGILVANTGDSFEFGKQKVRDSLRILGHSEKTEEKIGDFGVGLTAIRSIGESYEVWSKDPNGAVAGSNDYDHWRVLCSPRSTIGAIARPWYQSLSREAKDVLKPFFQEIHGLTHSGDSLGDSAAPSEFLESEKIPYFAYPVALNDWYDSFDREVADRRRRRTHELLTGELENDDLSDNVATGVQSLLEDVGEFKTAVLVDYEDDIWRAIYDELSSEDQTLSENNHATRLRSQAWYHSENVEEADASTITPELLLNLRGIDQLVVEDVREQETRMQRWDVYGRRRTRSKAKTTRNPTTFGSDEDALNIWEVSVEVETVSGVDNDGAHDRHTTTHEFLNCAFENGRELSEYDQLSDVDTEDDEVTDLVSVLLPRDPFTGRKYHPHLYYPISRNDADRQFPFCVHGDFVVQQDRQSLSADALQRNCVVTAEAARLVGRVGEVLATQDQWSRLRDATPWCLLPDAAAISELGGDETSGAYWKATAEADTTTVDNNAPFDALRADIYRELRNRSCLQVLANGGTQRAVNSTSPRPLISEKPEVIGAFAALHSLAEEDTLPKLVEDEPFTCGLLTKETLDALSRWLTRTDADSTDAFAELFDQLDESRNKDHTTRGDWNDRLDALRLLKNGPGDTNVGEEEDIDQGQFETWGRVLRHWADGIAGPAISNVPWHEGHALLEGTLALSDDSELLNTLTSNPGADPYLLPCRPPEDSYGEAEHPDTVRLVTVEDHRTDGDRAGGNSFGRQVLRPKDGGEVPSLPDDSNFTVFSLTRRAGYDEIATAAWGTRQHEGPTDFYQVLLKDIGDRFDMVERQDLEVLTEQYKFASPEKSALIPGEGTYHDFGDISTLGRQGSDASDDIQIRNRARRTDISEELLSINYAWPGRTITFGPELRAAWFSDEEDTGQNLYPDSEELVQSSFDVPAVLGNDLGSSVDQLGMLGVSILPGVRVITSVTDRAHPNAYEWNPHEWSALNSATDADRERAKALKEELSDSGRFGYLDAISTPPFGPGVSAGHSDKCDVREYPDDDLTELDVRLASWVWMEAEYFSQLSGEVLESLLRSAGEALVKTVLVTGWVCDEDHNPKHINERIPTLLNWQLRCIFGTDISSFHDPMESGSEPWQLRYAVLGGGEKSATAKWLPRITTDGPVPEYVWETLGIKRIGDINATDAAVRLSGLISRHFSDDPTPALEGRDYEDKDGWRTVYQQLIAPIADALSEFDGGMSIEDLQFLNRVPAISVHDGDPKWVAPTVDELRTADTRYYEQEERTWENRTRKLAGNDTQYLLPRLDSRHLPKESFEALCEDLEAAVEETNRPSVEESAQGIDRADLFREKLQECKWGMLAAAPGKPEANIGDYESAIKQLRAYHGSDQAWGFTPLENDSGVSLENVEGQNAPSYAPAFSRDAVDPDDLTELAELFQALFGGGSIDSYRLALSGGRVEGEDEVRARIREDSYQELRRDISVVASLLDVPVYEELLDTALSLEEGIPETSPEQSPTEIRRGIADLIQGKGPDSALTDAQRELGEALQTDVEDGLTEWVGTRLRTDRTWSEAGELAVDPSLEVIPDWHQTLLTTIRTQDGLSHRDILPPQRVQQEVTRLCVLIRSASERDSLPDGLGSTADVDWAHRVNRESTLEETHCGSDDYTWTHLALWAERTEEWTEHDIVSRMLSELTETDEKMEILKRKITSHQTANREYETADTDRDLETRITLSGADFAIDTADASADSFSASSRSGAGGYSGAITERPRVAELALLRQVYRRLSETGIDQNTLLADLRAVEDDQHYWHTNGGWEDVEQLKHSLEKGLPDSSDELTGTIPAEAFDVTDERGPGYDILDPTGSTVLAGEGQYEHPDTELLAPVPVEVKSVSNPENPSFRFSVNQFRRAINFVTEGQGTGPSIPYVILLLVVEGTDSFETSVCRRHVFTSVEDAYDLLPDDIVGGTSTENPIAEIESVDKLLMEYIRGGSFIIS